MKFLQSTVICAFLYFDRQHPFKSNSFEEEVKPSFVPKAKSNFMLDQRLPASGVHGRQIGGRQDVHR